MSQDYNWVDDCARERRSTAVFEAADATAEIQGLATALEDEWFSRDLWIDWSSFVADLNCVVIPSTGRDLDFGIDPGSPAMVRVQRRIRRHRMASITRWKLTADRTAGAVIAKPASWAATGLTCVDGSRSTAIPDTSSRTW
ncbi:hypothetical protein [Pengzhenrongella sicca]|uniref:Uncharacterized protein n=1 Tax=Pengzhenrongella sicca TaxID=2819238 RepID=A0A8A4ZB26_9MICO|nr:hypothetical protein [Pengzhenrongella sicca]QTE28083.1 hypothetical protein J4E96_11840 [Pengzhenrongella sicca]